MSKEKMVRKLQCGLWVKLVKKLNIRFLLCPEKMMQEECIIFFSINLTNLLVNISCSIGFFEVNVRWCCISKILYWTKF